MEPFNIQIEQAGNSVTLTILPDRHGYFKVIYYAGIIGAIQRNTPNNWGLVPDEQVEAGDLPPYHHDLEAGEVEVILNEATVAAIGSAIQQHLQEE